MRIAFVNSGLPGPGFHGGAMTCWAVIKSMISRSHDVTLISLFDTSDLNPYLASKESQLKELSDAGCKVEFIYYDYRMFKNKVQAPGNLLKNLFNPGIEILLPWERLASEVEEKLHKIKPDAIFCYHFDSLSCVFKTKIAPIMAGVGDLWHLPRYHRWLSQKISFQKYFFHAPLALIFSLFSKRFMLQMLKPCVKRGAFAYHYALWLRRQKGFSDTLYLRTPVHDPVGSQWRQMRDSRAAKKTKPRILLVGDLKGTATMAGLKLLGREMLPILEEKIGADKFEIHIVGGGELNDKVSKLLERPNIKFLGRVIPPDEEFLSSDILLVPNPMDLGIRVRIITGFSFGCCVVTHRANISGIPEIIHEKNALVAGNGKDLAHQVVRAIEDKKLRESIAELGRKTFEDYFSESKAGEAIVKEVEGIAV